MVLSKHHAIGQALLYRSGLSRTLQNSAAIQYFVWSFTPTMLYSRRTWQKTLEPFLDLCVSSLRRGHANLLCIVPILSDLSEDGEEYFRQHIFRGRRLKIYLWAKFIMRIC